MKTVFLRACATGLAGGLGLAMFLHMMADWKLSPQQWFGGLLLGIVFGVVQGLLMMLILLLLRLIDRKKGWALARRLEESEPGLAGFLLALLLTFPGATLGGVGCTIAAFHGLKAFYFAGPPQWAPVVTFFLGLMLLPLAALGGASLGALSGSAVGAGLAGMLRGLIRGRRS